MKIGMLGDTFLPLTGGAEIHILELSRALRDLGHEITICTAVDGEKIIDGFPVVRLPGLKGGGIRSLPYIPFALRRLIKFVRNCDVLHCHYSFLMAFLGTSLGKLYTTPSVVVLHGLGTLDSSVRNLFLRKIYRYVSLRLASAVIATSEEMQDVASRYADKIKIFHISNGVDTHRFSPASIVRAKGQPFVIMTMRRLVPKNGVQYLVESVPYIAQENLNFQIWIIGKDRLETYLRQRAKELGVDKFIRFIDEVPHHLTRDYYSQADIVVFPSSAESTSLACLEAMSMEKAIVASGLRAFHEMLGENKRGMLVKLFDRESSDYNAPLTLPAEKINNLAQGILAVMNDDEMRTRLGRLARQYVVDNYDWHTIAKKTEQIYNKICAHNLS